MKKLLFTLIFGSVLYAQSPVTTLQDISIIDKNNDGYAEFDLTSNKNTLLDGLDAEKHLITYHLTFNDADLNRNIIVKPAKYTNTVSGSQELYARVTSKTDPTNYSVELFNITAYNPHKNSEEAAVKGEKGLSE